MLPKPYELSKTHMLNQVSETDPLDSSDFTEGMFSTEVDNMANRAEAAFDDLSEQFQNWMISDLNRLYQAWADASSPKAIAEDYRKLFTAAHDIRGVAVSYGFPAISRLCGSLCTLLSVTKPGENSPLINLHIDACRAAYTTNHRSGKVDKMAYAVCDALERRVAVSIATGV